MNPRQQASADIERIVAQLRKTPANGETATEFGALMVEYRRLVKICRDQAPSPLDPDPTSTPDTDTAPDTEPQPRPSRRRSPAPSVR